VLLPVVALYLVAALRPFRFDLPNRVENGLSRRADGTYVFDGSALARTREPQQWIAEAARTDAFALTLELRTTSPRQSGPARIFTVSRDAYRRDLTVAQDGGDLVLRLRRPGADANGEPSFRVEDVFRDRSWHEIAVSATGGELAIVVDGEPRLDATLGSDPFARWEILPVALGNELTGDRGWSGEIRRATVRVASGTTDYLTQPLAAPEHWWTFPEVTIATRSDPRDMTLNVLGFLPLGGLVAVLARRRPIESAAAVGLLISIGMEAGQVFALSRDTSAVDVTLNVFGATGGSVVVAAVRRWDRSRPRVLTRDRPPRRKGSR
jgi:hypothetical protein